MCLDGRLQTQVFKTCNEKKNHIIADINSFLIFERASKHTVYSCLSRTSGVKYVMVCCWYGQQVDWLEQKPTNEKGGEVTNWEICLKQSGLKPHATFIHTFIIDHLIMVKWQSLQGRPCPTSQWHSSLWYLLIQDTSFCVMQLNSWHGDGLLCGSVKTTCFLHYIRRLQCVRDDARVLVVCHKCVWGLDWDCKGHMLSNL